MTGQFIFSTCRLANVEIRAFLRNTSRMGERIPAGARARGLTVDLRIFERGKLVGDFPRFARIGLDDIVEVSKDTCPALMEGEEERVVVARCSLESDEKGYLPQEHQITYRDRSSGKFSSLLYDQLPVFAPGKVGPPIILIAPKIWVGGDLNTYVMFANASSNSGTQSVPLRVSIMDEAGQVVSSLELEEQYNSARVLDVRAILANRGVRNETPRFYCMVARGGSSTYAISTLIKNHCGGLTVEHSLSPHYYLSGDFARVRREAVVFS